MSQAETNIVDRASLPHAGLGSQSGDHRQVTNSETPFGGLKHSGYGHENSIEGLEAFLATRNVNEIY